MSIGLHDLDMANYTYVPFNLELMKLSAYYKKNREIVILSPNLTPERHQKFFVRKDFDDGNFPLGLEKIPNIEYGGYAFTDGIYVPMAPEIEIMHPDTSLYANMEKAITGSGRREHHKIFQNMTEAEHCRLSLDGKTIWEDYPKQFKFLKTARNLMIHDYDLAAIDGGLEEVKRLMARARTDGWATRLGMKFPPVISNGQDLLDWISFKPNSTFYSLRYDGVMDEDCFDEFVSVCRENSIYKQLDYYVTASSANEQEFIDKYIIPIYRQVVKSRSYRVFFSLKYEENFFSDKRWERVLDLFNFYHNSLRYLNQAVYYSKIAKDTLYDFAKASYDKLPGWAKTEMDRQEMREIFMFVREKKPELFVDFYEFYANKMEGW
jgi:hypothetical protein